MMLLIPGLLACGKQKEPEDDDSYIYSLNEDQTGIVNRPYPNRRRGYEKSGGIHSERFGNAVR